MLYFSWIRERVGMGEETLGLPESVDTVEQLLSWLQGRNDQFAAALEFPEIIRVALDQQHVDHDQPIGAPREIALFPPMTGG
ncbi:MAG: molybdopterin converting factor subunit 1 [Rhizobiaceae bacterium]|nr:molybdopterin converting factor subunit 1 [Hyphomicrobiales bacterium]NRB31569.1 molybdopterin converting factor subunit 1 [Rhizobiaceae bacterium]